MRRCIHDIHVSVLSVLTKFTRRVPIMRCDELGKFLFRSNSEAEELWRKITAEMTAAVNSDASAVTLRIRVPEALRPLWEALRTPAEDEVALNAKMSLANEQLV